MDSLPPRLDYLRPVIQHFLDLPLPESCEDADTSVLEAALSQRVDGLSASEAESTLRGDRKALGEWLANSGSAEAPAHFIFGWMMMGGGPLLDDEDTAETISEMLSDLPTAPPGREFGPLPTIEPVNSDLRRDDGSLFLYISNSAFEPERVDICVSIDGEVVVHDVFEHQLMHDFTRYRICLETGEHQLVATSQRAEARIEEQFLISDILHASIAFWYSVPSAFDAERAPCFTFHAEEKAWIPEHGWKPAK